MTEIPDLLPCPFCGGDAEYEPIPGGGWSVGCSSDQDGACLGYQSLTQFARKDDAKRAWNKRAIPAPVASEEIANWYDREGWKLDESDVADAIRALAQHEKQAETGAHTNEEARDAAAKAFDGVNSKLLQEPCAYKRSIFRAGWNAAVVNHSFSTTGAEDKWLEDMENACPHFGGSGHKGDVDGNQ